MKDKKALTVEERTRELLDEAEAHHKLTIHALRQLRKVNGGVIDVVYFTAMQLIKDIARELT